MAAALCSIDIEEHQPEAIKLRALHDSLEGKLGDASHFRQIGPIFTLVLSQKLQFLNAFPEGPVDTNAKSFRSEEALFFRVSTFKYFGNSGHVWLSAVCFKEKSLKLSVPYPVHLILFVSEAAS